MTVFGGNGMSLEKYLITHLPTSCKVECSSCESNKAEYFSYMYGADNLWFCEICLLDAQIYTAGLNAGWKEYLKRKKTPPM